jgi:hypothetical protein
VTNADEIWPCVGICMPDEDEAYCLGCGRPWGEPRPAPKPPAGLPAEPAAKTDDPPAPA